MHKATVVDGDMTVAEIAKVMVGAVTTPRGEVGSVLVAKRRGTSGKAIETGAVPECSLSNIEGIITERDVLRLVANGLDPTTIRAHEIMSSPLITISAPDEPIDNASLLMFKHGIRRLPVVENGKIIGIVTSRDVANSKWLVERRGY